MNGQHKNTRGSCVGNGEVQIEARFGISVLGWLKNWLGLRVLVYYMETQKYTPPSDEEIAACTSWVISAIFRRIR